jgi:hypothetical protein
MSDKGKWCEKQAMEGSQQCKTHTAQTRRKEQRARELLEEVPVPAPKVYAPTWSSSGTDDPSRAVKFGRKKVYHTNTDVSKMKALGKSRQEQSD